MLLKMECWRCRCRESVMGSCSGRCCRTRWGNFHVFFYLSIFLQRVCLSLSYARYEIERDAARSCEIRYHFWRYARLVLQLAAARCGNNGAGSNIQRLLVCLSVAASCVL